MKKFKLSSVFGFVAALAMALSLVSTSVVAAGLSQTQISAIVSLLQSFGADAATVANVTAALNGQSTTGTVSSGSSMTVSSGYSFTKDLTIGSKGADVTALQQILVNQKDLVMPAGVAYGYFGTLTQTALAKFQAANGIAPASGYFGPITRASAAFMAANGGSSVSVGNSGSGSAVVPSGTQLNVSLAPTSPVAGAIVAGQAAADLAEYTFTNTSATPAVITNVTLMRSGVSADTSLSNVYLYNGATRLTDGATVSSGQITFNASTGLFTVPAGSSMTIAVKADIASSAAAGQIIIVSLTGVTANVPVSAVYPIGGASMTVASASDIAGVTVGSNTVNAESITAGSMNQTIWSAPLTITNRAVYLKSAAFKVIGSIPSNSLQNITLYVSGVQVATASGIDANGMITFDLTSNPYKMDSSRTLEVRADIVNGSSRSFNVSLQNAADLQVVDSNYNVGIAASGIPNNGGSISVSQGSVTVTQDTTLASGNVVTGASNVPLARYTFKAYGEDEKISYLYVGSNKQLDNVSVYANGVQIGSTQTIAATGTIGSLTSSNTKLYSLGSSLIIPAGSSVTVEVRGNLTYNGTNATTTSPNNTVQVGILGYTNNAQGSYSQQLSTVPSTEVDGPVMTVVNAGLSFGANSNYLNQTNVPNTANQKIGSYTLSANSSEPIKITSATVAVGGAAGTSTNLSNLYLVVSGAASQTTTPIGAPQASNNYALNVTIPTNGSITVDVYGDLGSVSGVASTSLTVQGYGMNSNTSVSQGPVTGQTITVGAGSLSNPTLQTGAGYSPDSQLVVGGTTAPIAYYNFVSSNGASTITEMYFTVTGGISSVTVGGVTTNVINGAATSTGLSIPVAVGYAGANVPVTVTYSPVGLNGTTSVQNTSVTLTGFKYTSGNSTVSTSTLSVGSHTMVLVASKPTVSIASSGQTGSGTKALAEITVSADAGGPINLQSLPISITTSAGSSVTSLTQLYVNGSLVSGVTGGISSVATSSTATATLAFSGNGYPIAAGSSVTFEVRANVNQSATGDSVQTSVGTTSAFVWQDVNGNATTTGQYIFNYPANSAVVTY